MDYHDNDNPKTARPKHNHPKVETVEPMVYYSFNLNPNDALQFKHENEVRRHHSFKDLMITKLNRYFAPYVCDMEFYIEISPNGRLHLHGQIKFKDYQHIISFYLHGLKEIMEFSTTDMKKIEDDKGWKTYITKQANIWASINFVPLICLSDCHAEDNRSNRQILRDEMDNSLEYGVVSIKKSSLYKKK